MTQVKSILLVNFGGPRHLNEVAPFLRELLTDREVIRTAFPDFLHKWLFTRVADKRAKTVVHDYQSIGGKSPIYEDTENLATALAAKLQIPVLAFHRYLPQTHETFLEKASQIEEALVFPLFPQFSYATTGSIALWLSKHLTKKLMWIPSYAEHPEYVKVFQKVIKESLRAHDLNEAETLLFFSAHGLPQQFIDTGDIYQNECERSYRAIKRGFPLAETVLAYQSQFGKEEWLRPYTSDLCQKVGAFGKKNVLFIPLSFTSDHIETLFEVEEQYLPPVRALGLGAYRCPALNLRPDWIEAMAEIIQGGTPHFSTSMLMRHKSL